MPSRYIYGIMTQGNSSESTRQALHLRSLVGSKHSFPPLLGGPSIRGAGHCWPTGSSCVPSHWQCAQPSPARRTNRQCCGQSLSSPQSTVSPLAGDRHTAVHAAVDDDVKGNSSPLTWDFKLRWQSDRANFCIT